MAKSSYMLRVSLRVLSSFPRDTECINCFNAVHRSTYNKKFNTVHDVYYVSKYLSSLAEARSMNLE